MGKFKDKTKRLFRELVRVHGSPSEIAGGVALGTFINLTPTFGIQLILAILLSALLKVNKIATVLAVQPTNIFTVPFIYTLNYKIGKFIIGGNNSIPKFAEFEIRHMLDIGKQIWVGGIVLGIIAGGVSYIVTFRLVEAYQKRKQAKQARKRLRNIN